MSTSAQQKANQQNAQHSTGPRTAEGKQRASQNAIKHGLCSKDPLIPGEDPEAFEQHFSEIELDLRPAGAIESNLVEQIADVSWRLKRLSRIEAAVITEFYDTTAEQPHNQGSDEDLIGKALARHNRLEALNRLSRYEGQLSRRYHRALKEFRDLRKERIRGRNFSRRAIKRQPTDTAAKTENTEPTQSTLTLLKSIDPVEAGSREHNPGTPTITESHRIHPDTPGRLANLEAKK